MTIQPVRTILMLSCAAILLVAPAGVAAAQDFGRALGGAIFNGIGGAIGGGHYKQYNGSGGRKSKGDHNDSQSSKDDPSRDDRVLSSLAPTPQRQNVVLKSISASETLGLVGQNKELIQIGKANSTDKDRDYTALIGDIISRFKEEQARAKSSIAGDVTQHAIEQSLDRAYKDAKLNVFESFLGENWSAERLRVMVLQRVKDSLGVLFAGNNRGNAPMEELNRLIAKSAEAIYHRVFEISELLADNRSTTLFVQRLYQTHGSLVDDQLREDTDRMISKAANAALAKFESAMRRDEDGFALRYRAQRIVLDCLSDNVEKLSSSETGIKTIGEINSKIAKVSTGICVEWLDNQFGGDKDRIKSQKPMPLRAVWSPTGPKDDPSMYGRINSTF